MYELKPISKEAVPAALRMAERYRLLNEPREAESICRDILDVDPDNEKAVIIMLLALTDQFATVSRITLQHAEEALLQMDKPYDKLYYGGVISERWAKAQVDGDVPGHVVYHWLHRAMELYEKAQAQADAGDDQATLRWNTCARIINQDCTIRPRAEDLEMHAGFEDEVPYR